MPKETKKYDPFSTDVNVWNVDSRYGVADSCIVDTLVTSYQDNQPINNYTIARSWNGNLGSPLESKIFFDRLRLNYENMFAQAYIPYTIKPEEVRYYDVKQPFAQLVYRTAFPKYREEDHLKALFTMNANKYVNVGGLCNFIYGRGQYLNQSSRMVTGGFWASYTGKKYEVIGSVMLNSFKNKENGGIQQAYIDNMLAGQNSISAPNLPVNMNNAQQRYRNFNYFLHNRYSLGRDKERKGENDSIIKYFQPIITFSHTFRAEDVSRIYIDKDVPDFAYYYNEKLTDDSASYFSIRNTIAVTMNEEFNTLMRFGVRAFVEYDVNRYKLFSDSTLLDKKYQHHLKVGAQMFKNSGKYIRYHIDGEVYLVGPRIGDFDIKGNIHSFFDVKSRRFDITADVSFARYEPYFWYEHYYSNQFRWDNNFNNQLALDVKGRFSMTKPDLSLGVQFRNITNYVYLNEECVPEQSPKNIQVLAVDLKAHIQMWKFYLDATAVYQLTSDKERLPLPDVALYGSFYFMGKIVKELTLQVGASVRYHTAYYGNAYMPSLGAFYLQKQQLIGNYPEMNIFLNCHLKTMRFFFQYSHFNKGLFGGNNYLAMPGYPINPATFQMGLSWNFW